MALPATETVQRRKDYGCNTSKEKMLVTSWINIILLITIMVTSISIIVTNGFNSHQLKSSMQVLYFRDSQNLLPSCSNATILGQSAETNMTWHAQKQPEKNAIANASTVADNEKDQ